MASSVAVGTFGDIKGFLYAWLGKQNKLPSYDISQQGNKQRIRFKCEVIVILLSFLVRTDRCEILVNRALVFLHGHWQFDKQERCSNQRCH